VAFWCVWSFLRCGSYMSVGLCSCVMGGGVVMYVWLAKV